MAEMEALILDPRQTRSLKVKRLRNELIRPHYLAQSLDTIHRAFVRHGAQHLDQVARAICRPQAINIDVKKRANPARHSPAGHSGSTTLPFGTRLSWMICSALAFALTKSSE